MKAAASDRRSSTSTEGDPIAQLAPKPQSLRSQDSDTAECPVLRFKMISKHPEFPHNKLFSVTTDESLEQLQEKISKLTRLRPRDFALFWEDADKYRFALNAPADWQEALSYFSENRSTMNLKIYVTAAIAADPGWAAAGAALAARAQNLSFSLPADPAQLFPEAGADEIVSPTSRNSRQSNRVRDAHSPVDEPIAEGCDSFVTSSTATQIFNEAEATLPESLSCNFLQNPTPRHFGVNLQQSFNQPLANLSFSTMGEKPASPQWESPAQRMLWRRGRVLGKGAYGTVYLGMNSANGELLAVKQVCIEEEQQGPPTPETVAQLRALAQEIRLMENLQHPNIVRYLGTDRADNGIYIFMEYIPGGSIASLLKQFGPFQEKLICAYLKQILQGLDYLHGQHVLHRDIKGANILVSHKGEIKLADFGSSKSLQDLVQSASVKNTFVGTAEWMAPEAITCKNQTKPADIWSLGCTILEMAYADTPWSRTMQERRAGIAALYFIASTQERPRIPTDLLSEEACDFLHHCLQRDPALRPSTGELLQHPWLQGVSPFTSHPGTPLSPPTFPSVTRTRSDCLNSPSSPFVKSMDSEPPSGESEEEQEQRILTFVKEEVQRTLNMTELSPLDGPLDLADFTVKLKARRRGPTMTIQPPPAAAAPQPPAAVAALGRPDSQTEGTRPGGEFVVDCPPPASVSSSSSPRRSPCSPGLINASFASACSVAGAALLEMRQGSVRRRRAVSQGGGLATALDKSNFDIKPPARITSTCSSEREAPPVAVGYAPRHQRAMLLGLVVVLISIVLAAFVQGYCRSLVAETRARAGEVTTPLLCLPIYNVAPPLDYLVLFVCYVCVGFSAVALQFALSVPA